MNSLEKIIKKSKNFVGASLLGFASLYACQNPAIVKPTKPEITNPVVEPPKPTNPIVQPPKQSEAEKVYVHFENTDGIKTYAFGDNGEQRWDTEFNIYRYPDQKEYIKLLFKDAKGNIVSQAKQIEAFKKIAGNYELKLFAGGVFKDESIEGEILENSEGYFLRLPVNETDSDKLTRAQKMSMQYDLNENIIPNGIYQLKGEKVTSPVSSPHGSETDRTRYPRSVKPQGNLEVLFANKNKDGSVSFGVLDKDNFCRDGLYTDPRRGGCFK